MNELIRQAQLMQKKMMKIQEESGKKEVEASVGGGMVTMRATCSGELVSVTIDPSVAGDVDMLQDLVLSAANEALKKGKDLMQAEMAQITGGMKIPGLF